MMGQNTSHAVMAQRAEPHDWLVAHAYIMYANTPWTIAEIARRLGVSRRKVNWAIDEARRRAL